METSMVVLVCTLLMSIERKSFRLEVDRLRDWHREFELALPFDPTESEQRKAGDEKGQEEEIKRSNTMSVHHSGDRKHTQLLYEIPGTILSVTSRRTLTRVLHREPTKVTLLEDHRDHFSPTYRLPPPISPAQTHTRKRGPSELGLLASFLRS